MRIDRDRDAFLLIDVQNDFCPGGSLAVPDGDAIVAPINQLLPRFAQVIAAQDWHPANHASFAANYPGAESFSQIEMPYGAQTLWPVHCVQGTKGAEYHPGVSLDRATAIIRKGWRSNIDSYSAFLENDKTTPTGLGGLLRERGLTRVFVAGLATDVCVSFSALDAKRLGFDVFVVLDACRGLDPAGAQASVRSAWKEAGVEVIESSAV